MYFWWLQNLPDNNDLKDNETKKIITAVKTKYFVDNNKKIKF